MMLEMMQFLDCYDEILEAYNRYQGKKELVENWAFKYINFIVKKTMNTRAPVDVPNCLILTLNLLLRDLEGLDMYNYRGKKKKQLDQKEHELFMDTLMSEFNM